MAEILNFDKLKENESKFIQVYINEEPFLIFFPKNYYHGLMLMDLLNERRIIYKTKKDKSLMQQIPLEKGDGYELVGAGKAVYVSQDILKFYDISGSYLIGTNLKHLDDIFKDKKPDIQQIGRYKDYLVNFNNSNKIEKKNGEKSSGIILKSNLKDESDEVPF